MRPSSSKKSKKNYSIETETNRPKSALIKYPYITTTQSNPYFTMPNNPKLSKGMGQKIEKEQLYEDTVHLKKTINNLKKQLEEARNKIAEQDLEIKQKNKMIEECTEDDKIEFFEEDKSDFGKSSTLLSLCKEKLNEMKKNYKDKCLENEFLKQDIKITKIKENQIESDIFKQELEKLKNLYMNSKEIIESGNKEIDYLKEYKNKFNEQNILLNSIQKDCDKLNKDNIELKEKINKIEGAIEKNKLEKQKLNIQNMKLKNTNEQYIIEKKQNGNNSLNVNYPELISKLKYEIGLYKTLCHQRNLEIQRLKEKHENIIKKKKDELTPMLKIKKTNYESLANSNKADNKMSLIKSLLHDAQIKIIIYENFFNDNGQNFKQILKEGGYNIDLENDSNNNNNNNNDNNNNNNNNNNNTGNSNAFGNSGNSNFGTSGNIYYVTNQSDKLKGSNNFESNHINYTYSNTNTQNLNTNQFENNNINNNVSNNINNNENNKENINENNNENINENNNNIVIDENTLSHVIMKNLESNNITSKILEEQLNNIFKQFENEISSEDFIKPFLQLLIEDMKVTNNQDIEILNVFLNKILEKFENDTDKFIEIITGIFTSVFDYSTINKKEMDENLKIELIKYPNLLNKFHEKDHQNTYIITYYDFKEIHGELHINLQDSLMEYFIYLMKKDVPVGHSIFDLSYKIIDDLLKENLPQVEDIIKSNDNKLTSLEEIIDPEKIKDKEINYEELKNTEEFKNNDLKQSEDFVVISNDLGNTNSNQFGNTDPYKNTDFQNNDLVSKIQELKQNLIDKNLQFNNLIERKVENIENDEGNVKRGIRKDDFIEILKENGVDVEKDEEQSIYEKYKMDEKFNDSQQLLDITLIENEMAKND